MKETAIKRETGGSSSPMTEKYL